jgi:Transposase DDE domain
MSHRDSWLAGQRLNAGLLKVALLWLFRGINWSSIQWRIDCTWSPRLLASAALLWVWSDEANLVARFVTARKIALFLFGTQEKVAQSYQAFIKLLVRWTPALTKLIQTALQQRMQTELKAVWQVGGRLLFGMDGSKIVLPRTMSNEKAYAAMHRKKKRLGKNKLRKRRKRRGQAGLKKAAMPQLSVVTVWHVGSGLPWTWRIGSSYAGERTLVREMLPEVPEGAVLAGDAGMVGFETLRQARALGHHLLIRVGSNVHLLKQLGVVREYDGIVYLWPVEAQDQAVPPLVLRMIVSHNGKHPVYLVTTMLDEADCSDADVIAMYKLRWGIEVYHRSLKQTFQRRKLRSHSAAPAHVELQWSLIGLWAMSLYALVQIRRDRVEPNRLSCAKLLQAFRRMMRDYLHPVDRHATLCQMLRQAVIDAYQRKTKKNRDYPRKKRESPPGAPIITRATPEQITLAMTLRNKTQLGLTA